MFEARNKSKLKPECFFSGIDDERVQIVLCLTLYYRFLFNFLLFHLDYCLQVFTKVLKIITLSLVAKCLLSLEQITTENMACLQPTAITCVIHCLKNRIMRSQR